MIPYSLHVAIILAVCLGFYRLLLQKETYFRVNRTVLLLCLALSFLLPYVPVPERYSAWKAPAPLTFPEPAPASSIVVPQHVSSPPEPVKATESRVLPTVETTRVPLAEQVATWALRIYWCGVAILLANLLVQLVTVLYRSYRKPAIRDGMFRIVELDGNLAPHSFGTTIFINPARYDWETYSQIIAHEKVHVRQGHSVDLVLAELALVVQWFNPFAWLYRREIESNLEYLADDAVLHGDHLDRTEYQLSLLKVAVPNWATRITTNYNQSLLKKRIAMMNARKSNVHIAWKYLAIAPVMVLLLCAFNKPVAAGRPEAAGLVAADIDQSKGLWFADIKGDDVRIEFKSDDDNNRRWSSSASFKLNELASLPKVRKADFPVSREAGTVTFNGKFDGEQGYGHYKFKADKNYKKLMEAQGMELDDDDCFSFFMLDVRKEYVKSLKDNGFTRLSKSQVLSMAAFRIDEPFINYWKQNGFPAINASNLVSLKSLKIDSAYANEIRRAGYTDLTVQQLISFKQQGITGDYINGLRKASLKDPSKRVAEKPTPTEIVRSKSMKIDSNYVAGMRDAGFSEASGTTITTLKNQGITPEFAQTFADAGLSVPASSISMLKSQGITAEFIKSFHNIGMTDIPLSTYSWLKAKDITAAFIKGYRDAGITDISLNTYPWLKERELTPALIKSYRDIGKSAQDIGLKDLSFNTINYLKERELTPAYIRSFYDNGMKDYNFTTLQSLKSAGISPEFIKGFRDIGYTNVTVSQLISLKSNGITPEFVRGFQKLGYPEVLLSQVITLKTSGVTPGFVADMKQRGFESKDLNKYIQLKSFNPHPKEKGGF